MSRRSCGLIPFVAILFYSGCAPRPAATEAAGFAAAKESQMSDLTVTPVTRRLHAAKGWIDGEMRPSPDGHYVSMTDWATGDLALHDLGRDSTFRLTKKGSWSQSNDFAQTTTIAPDGKSLAYGWYTGAKSSFEIRVMSITGSDSAATRSIYSESPSSFKSVQAWTPDGRNVVAVTMDSLSYITVVPVAGGTPKRIKTLRWASPENLSVSPDGKWLAYDFPADEERGERKVFLLAIDGSSESVLSNETENAFVVGWTRDGGRLLYGTERNGNARVLALTVASGKAIGSPVLVRSDMLRMFPLGPTRTGTILYGVKTGTRDVIVASMNPKTGALVSRPLAMQVPSDVSPLALAWSPDGKHMAQVALRGSSGISAPSDIVIRSIDRGEMRRLSPSVTHITAIYWPDEKSSLIVCGTTPKGRPGIFAVDLTTGGTRVITYNERIARLLTIAPDGKTAYFVTSNRASGKYALTRLDLASGAMQIVHTIDTSRFVVGMAISPDGLQLGIGISGSEYPHGIIALLPVTGGELREIYRFNDLESINAATSFVWSSEGRDLVFGVVQGSDSTYSKVDVRALSISDRTLRSLHIPSGRISTIRISPDNRRIAYFVNDIASELWTMDEPVFSTNQKVAGSH